LLLGGRRRLGGHNQQPPQHQPQPTCTFVRCSNLVNSAVVVVPLVRRQRATPNCNVMTSVVTTPPLDHHHHAGLSEQPQQQQQHAAAVAARMIGRGSLLVELQLPTLQRSSRHFHHHHQYHAPNAQTTTHTMTTTTTTTNSFGLVSPPMPPMPSIWTNYSGGAMTAPAPLPSEWSRRQSAKGKLRRRSGSLGD
jgi:hypothetical protein